jgi:hypothetical protein
MNNQRQRLRFDPGNYTACPLKPIMRSRRDDYFNNFCGRVPKMVVMDAATVRVIKTCPTGANVDLNRF